MHYPQSHLMKSHFKIIKDDKGRKRQIKPEIPIATGKGTCVFLTSEQGQAAKAVLKKNHPRFAPVFFRQKPCTA